MRLTALALTAVLAAGCGGDDSDEIPQTTPQPAPRQPVDTTLGDTVAGMEGDTAAPGRTQSDETRDPAGEPSGQPGAGEADAGQPDAANTTAGRVAAGERLYTVQVAAFTEATSASEWTGRLQRQGLPVWTSVAELGGQTFYRVRVGAVPTVSEARALGSMLSQRYEWPVWVAPLTPSDRIPQGAVEDTRGVLQGG